MTTNRNGGTWNVSRPALLGAGLALLAGGMIGAAMMRPGVAILPTASARLSMAPEPTSTNKPTTITSSGRGAVDRAPDRAVVFLGAVAQAKGSKDAQAKLNEVMARVIEEVKGASPDAVVQTVGLVLEPVYDYSKRKAGTPPTIVGYRASNRVKVRVDDLALAGEVIDAAIKAGANNVSGISFELKDDRDARNEALREAALKSRADAEALAAALGLRITGVVESTIGSPQVMPVWRSYEVMASAAPAAEPTPIEPGQISVSADVTVIYKAEPR
jgi:hypothetical protein